MGGLGQAGANWGSGVGAWGGEQMSDKEGDLENILKFLQEQYGDASKLDPSQLGSSAYNSVDPATRNAQMRALAQLQGISDAKGLDATAVGQNAESQRNAAGFERSQRGAINQDLQARGMGGGGTDIASLLSAEQAGANRVSEEGMTAAANAQQRNMAAIQGSGQLAGAVRGQDYTKAGALDSAKQRAWEGALQKLSAMGASRKDLENYYAAKRAQTIGEWSAMGSGLGGLVGTGADSIGGAASGGGGMGGGGLQASQGGGYTPMNFSYGESSGGSGMSKLGGDGYNVTSSPNAFPNAYNQALSSYADTSPYANGSSNPYSTDPDKRKAGF